MSIRRTLQLPDGRRWELGWDTPMETFLGQLYSNPPAEEPELSIGTGFRQVSTVDSALVEFETIYHRDDGSERIASPRRLSLEGFLELSFGHWYEGSWPPPAGPTRPRGQAVPLDPRKIGGRPTGS